MRFQLTQPKIGRLLHSPQIAEFVAGLDEIPAGHIPTVAEAQERLER
jgi:hypothetical protein